jgi:RNA polymerase sigma-70 factor (TIGR02957 family)
VSSTASFVQHRALLFTVAYEMLGTAADAEDVVQEAWLRWAARAEESGREEVRDPRAYLVRVTTRLALNRLRTLARRRESYVGPWLPEPLLTTPDVAEDVELADSVSTAMLLVLETLGPTERAVFVLREVFDVPYDEIAAAVDKSPDAVRQIAHRARSHVRARRPRHEVRREEQEAVLDRFFLAASTGDLQLLLDVLSPDVVLVTDGGGRKKAALRPIEGRDKTMRFLVGVSEGPVQSDRVWVNGAPGLAFTVAGELDTVITFHLEDGLVTGLYALRNPEKLRRLGAVTPLTR